MKFQLLETNLKYRSSLNIKVKILLCFVHTKRLRLRLHQCYFKIIAFVLIIVNIDARMGIVSKKRTID